MTWHSPVLTFSYGHRPHSTSVTDWLQTQGLKVVQCTRKHQAMCSANLQPCQGCSAAAAKEAKLPLGIIRVSMTTPFFEIAMLPTVSGQESMRSGPSRPGAAERFQVLKALLRSWCVTLVFALPAAHIHAAIAQVAASGNTSMAVDTNGNLFGWGDNGSGLLGKADKAYSPVVVPGQTPYGRGFAGTNRMFLIDTSSVLWGTGNNQFGQLGDGTFFLRRTSLVKLGSGYQDLAVGTFHTLAIKSDGSLWSWGSGDYGQLGDGLAAERSRPFALSLGKALSIAAGTYHSLAVLTDGSLWAWGNNQYGQLGDGTTANKSRPTKIGDGYVQVVAGDYFSMARKTDGTVVAWGRNNHGQLGDGGTNNSASAVQVPGRFTHIVAGASTGLALDASAGLWHWGRSLDSSVLTTLSTPKRITTGVRNISAGEQHLLLQKIDGSLYALGSNESGALGVEDQADIDTTVIVKVSNDPASFAAGGQQSLLIDTSGRAYAWGSNSEGQLGQGRDDRLSVPVLLASSVKQLALSNSVAYVIRDDGIMWAWGENRDGRLGDGSARSRSTLVKVGEGFETVSNGNTQALAIKTDGSLWAWGLNDFGQLGLGDVLNRSRPTKVGDGYRSVAAGAEHTLAIKTDGSLWSWGRNRYGQLGNGQFEQRFGPQANSTPVKIGDGYVSILAGAHHSLALKSDGSVWAWGWNDYGQVGNGTTNSQAVPVQVATNIAKLLSASINSVVLGLDGKTYVWGHNGEQRRRYNVLLAGSDVFTLNSPAAITGNWVAASAGSSHAIYLRKDGIAFSVGYQQFGQLGDGSFDDVRIHPSAVLGVDVSGLLDLQPATPKQFQPGDVPPVFVKTNRQGENTKLSMGVQVRLVPPPSGAGGTSVGIGPKTTAATGYQLYVVAAVPLAAGAPMLWVSLQPKQEYSSPTWAGVSQPLAAYLQNITTTDTSLVEFDVLDNLDTTQLAGASLYLGYGLNQDEMIQSQRYRVFFVVPTE